MASDEISELANALSKTHVGDGELSYKGKGLKLDNVESVEEMVAEITQYHGLRVLCLEGNTIGVEAAQAIAKALENKYELQRCYWSDMFTGRLRSEIPTALMSLGSALMTAGARLTELDLSDNAFGPDGLKGIEQLLKSPSCHSLKELRLNNCGMGIGGGKILAETLMESHRRSSAQGASLRLGVFHAGRNRLENEGACALAQTFQLVGSLVEVHMPQNGITHVGITALASALQHNTGLRVLNLNDNTFTKRGALAMAQALKHLKNVQAVNFGDCLVRSEGAIALAAVLREGLPVLKELNLSFGEITQGAALVVAHAIMEKPHMEKVDLNGNCLGEEGCEALRETMENMGKGHMLALLSDDEGEPDEEENGIDEEEENRIEENGEEEAENGMKEEEGKIVKENGVTSERNSPAKPPSPSDLVSFLCCPTAEMLLELGEKRTSLSQLVDICEPEHAADVFLKISSVYGEDPETKTAVLETIDGVLKKLLCGSTTLQAYCFLSSLLDRMGLLKGECKAKKMPLVPGQLMCLEHAIQEEYFSQDHALLLHIFICRNAALLKSCGGAAELLNTALKQRCGPEK